MRAVILALAAGVLMGGAAQAKDSPSAMASGADVAHTGASPTAKMLYVCGEDEQSWRMFSRDLGIPDFVTAAQVRAAANKAWDGPKCITPTELRRLTDGPSANLTRVTYQPAR